MSQLPPSPSEKTQISQEDQEIDAPLVFQCIHCNTIVADSFAWFESQQALNTITLYAQPSNVTVGAEFAFARTGADLGSAYKPICCIRCGHIVGKVYKVTPRWMDHLIDKYTFDLGAVSVYQLGRYINPSTISPSLTTMLDDLPTLPNARETRRSMEKMQKLICLFNERLLQLEQEMARTTLLPPSPPQQPQPHPADEPDNDTDTPLETTADTLPLSPNPQPQAAAEAVAPQVSSPSATAAPTPSRPVTRLSRDGGASPVASESREKRSGVRSGRGGEGVAWATTRDKRRKDSEVGEGRRTRGMEDKNDDANMSRKRFRQPAGR